SMAGSSLDSHQIDARTCWQTIAGAPGTSKTATWYGDMESPATKHPTLRYWRYMSVKNGGRSRVPGRPVQGSLARGPRVQRVLQRRLRQQSQRVRLLLRPGRSVPGGIIGRIGGRLPAAALVQRFARRL